MIRRGAMLSLLLPALVILGFSKLLTASTTSSDNVILLSVAGQSSSNGVSFSTNVYVVGSSVTLQGSGGYITTASSVTAASFFGDGSHLSVPNILAATQTFSGADTFTSSFTVQSGGRAVILSTSPSVNNLSISNAGVASFYPELHNSSHTLIGNFTTAHFNFDQCISGSTLTIITSGGSVEANFSGNVTPDGGSNGTYGLALLQDGQFVGDMSISTGAFVYNYAGAHGDIGSSFAYLINAPPPGTHSYCVTLGKISANTLTLNNGAIFYVKELK